MPHRKRQGHQEKLAPPVELLLAFRPFYCEQDCSTEIFLSTLLLTPIGPDDPPSIVLAQTSPVLEP
jgi:hypothetical protein